MRNFLITFVLFLQPAFSFEPSGYLKDLQCEISTEYLKKTFRPNEKGTLLAIGFLEEALDMLKTQFPFLSIETTPSDHRMFDSFISFLSLERDPNRELSLQQIYGSLNSGKQGMILVGPKGAYSLDDITEKFITDPKWENFISPTKNLTTDEYRNLIKQTGLLITDESLRAGFFCMVCDEEWVYDRWEVPEPIQLQFILDFLTYIRGERHVLYNFHELDVEKP